MLEEDIPTYTLPLVGHPPLTLNTLSLSTTLLWLMYCCVVEWSLLLQYQNRQSVLTNLLTQHHVMLVHVRINIHPAGQLKIFIITRTSSNHGSL